MGTGNRRRLESDGDELKATSPLKRSVKCVTRNGSIDGEDVDSDEKLGFLTSNETEENRDWLVDSEDIKSLSNRLGQRWSPCGAMRVASSMMIIVVCSIIGVNWWMFVFFFDLSKAWNVLANVVFHALVILTLVAYFQTAFTDPGTVPEAWHAAVMRSESSRYTKCKKSGLFKPPRSHFDSMTQRLVLGLDHFCPWVINAVGFYNRKFFIQFVTYAALTSLYATICFGALWMSSMTEIQERSFGKDFITSSDTVIAICLTIFDSILTLAVGLFASLHIYFLVKNRTTIEGFEVSKPYCRSMHDNVRLWLGNDVRYWFLPLWGKGPGGDGIHWRRVDDVWDGLTDEEMLREGTAVVMP